MVRTLDPMSYSTWLMDVVSDEFRGDRDVPVTALSGWKTRGDDASHAGVMDHHWGSRPGTTYSNGLHYITFTSPYAPSANICTGSPYAPDLDDFPITVCAAGDVNHAGLGKLSWLARNTGNHQMLGLEHYSTYDHVDWHPRHLEVQLRLGACLLEHMGQSWQRRADHKEYAPGRKVDRHHINTTQWDRDMRDLLAARAAGEPPEEDDMPLTNEDIQKIRTIVREEAGSSVYAVRHAVTRGLLDNDVLDWSSQGDLDDRVSVGNVLKGLHSRVKAILSVVNALASDHAQLADEIARELGGSADVPQIEAALRRVFADAAEE